MGETSSSSSEKKSMALSEVVADCVKRWFQETLKEAKSGDLSMQILVSQMYNSGYGVPVDPQKVITFFLDFQDSVFFVYLYVLCVLLGCDIGN